ncbi:hypothetical protein Cgig2_025806 [Carnegiea gigantea]|uniref:Uncharacterized protein n=1 Tax=Carnegiea gigantea TaxID=171969 RepID=A0A9Q1KEW5_9CARY|nr:hypothetical protein Cgig2_025806 [Carnegiea gigantea]
MAEQEKEEEKKQEQQPNGNRKATKRAETTEEEEGKKNSQQRRKRNGDSYLEICARFSVASRFALRRAEAHASPRFKHSPRLTPPEATQPSPRASPRLEARFFKLRSKAEALLKHISMLLQWILRQAHLEEGENGKKVVSLGLGNGEDGEEAD